ncbi:MAG: GIY-YIG nuclease family protein [Oscillospiraceae bacterium]|nr:GIY-YIG nuclease family protein [Oscillospiraceae bacterium]MBQ9148245.1 GIY-YIG nuclease family protein [Oscillospiraceae bacterium]
MSDYKPGRPAKFNPTTGAGTKPPSKPGEYRIRDSKGTLLYIGETNDIRRRMGEHIRSGKLTTGASGDTIEYKIASPYSTSQSRRAHEQQKIAQHNPPLNKSIGGEGRIAANSCPFP